MAQNVMADLPDNLDALLTIVEDSQGESHDVRIRAISRVGDLASAQANVTAIMALIDCVRQDGDPRIVTHAIGVLSRIKAYSAVPVMVDVLLATHIALYENAGTPGFANSDDSLRLRCAAAQALGRIGDDQAIIPLMSILNDKQMNYRLRLAAAESLGRLGDDHAVNPLIEILKDERENSVYLKESAAKALGMLGDIRAVEPLIAAFEEKRGFRSKFNFLKEQIIEAIGRIGKPDGKATDTLIYALSDEAPTIRLAAVEALETIGDGSCIPHLRPLIHDKDDDVAIAAIAAIYHLGGEAAIRELLTQEDLPQFLRDEMEGYIP